jgi:RNA polymerase sigma-70 factor (ECF subfamily)
VDSNQRAGVGQGNGDGLTSLQTVAAREDLVTRLEEQFDLELLYQALEAVQPRVAANNFEAFRLTALEGVAAAEVARRLDMKIARVYAARSTVQQLLQEECRKREGELRPGE